MSHSQITVRPVLAAVAAVLAIGAGGLATTTMVSPARANAAGSALCNPERGCIPAPCGGHRCAI